MTKSRSVEVGSKKVNLIPFSGWMVVFVLIPIALVVYYAFTGVDGFTLTNLKWIWVYRDTLWLSVWLSVIATVICLLLAYPVA